MADRLMYAVPTGRHPRMGFVLSMRGIELTCKTFDRAPTDFCYTVGLVQMARSIAAGKAIEGGYDYLVMHDDDLMVSPVGQCGNPLDAWHGLMQSNPDIGMIGAAYLAEHSDLMLATVVHPDYPATADLPEEVCHLAGGLTYAPTSVAGVGTGFVMIRVAALKALREAEKASGGGPPFKFPVRKNRFGAVVEVGEDYDFCQRLRANGWKVVVDPRFDTTHIKDTGNLTYNWHTYEQRFKEGPALDAELKRIGEVSQPGCQAIKIGGLICIDHTPGRKAEGEAVAKAQAEAQAKSTERAA